MQLAIAIVPHEGRRVRDGRKKRRKEERFLYYNTSRELCRLITSPAVKIPLLGCLVAFKTTCNGYYKRILCVLLLVLCVVRVVSYRLVKFEIHSKAGIANYFGEVSSFSNARGSEWVIEPGTVIWKSQILHLAVFKGYHISMLRSD